MLDNENAPQLRKSFCYIFVGMTTARKVHNYAIYPREFLHVQRFIPEKKRIFQKSISLSFYRFTIEDLPTGKKLAESIFD